MSTVRERLTYRQFFVTYVSGAGEYVWARDEEHARTRLNNPEDKLFNGGKAVESIHPVTESRPCSRKR